MATREARGWVWTVEERESIKTWQRRLQNQHSKLVDQVRLYTQQLPQFADEAKRAAQPFLDLCRPLLNLDARRSGRKYQAISPEEAQEGLVAANKAISQWNQFAGRSDVAGAVQALNAQHKVAHWAAKRAIAEHLAARSSTGRWTSGWTPCGPTLRCGLACSIPSARRKT